MTNILFSVIVPTYNRAHTIKHALASIERQTFREFEVIVVDDGSTDNTNAVIADYQSNFKLRLIKQSNQGVSVARNNGANSAIGLFLIFLDSDDQMESNYFAEMSAIIGQHESVKFISCGVKALQGGREIYFFPSPQPMYSGRSANMLAGGFVVAREIFLAVGGYDPRIYFGENGELGLRMLHLISLDQVIFTNQILLRVYMEDHKHRRLRYSAWKELSSCERILQIHGYRLIENDRNFYESMLSKVCVAALIRKETKKSRLYARKSFLFGKSLKSFVRLIMVYLFPNNYRRLLENKNYLP